MDGHDKLHLPLTKVYDSDRNKDILCCRTSLCYIYVTRGGGTYPAGLDRKSL